MMAISGQERCLFKLTGALQFRQRKKLHTKHKGSVSYLDLLSGQLPHPLNNSLLFLKYVFTYDHMESNQGLLNHCSEKNAFRPPTYFLE